MPTLVLFDAFYRSSPRSTNFL